MVEAVLEDEVSINSQLEWELEEGIPQPDEPFIQKYMAGRAALIEQEKKQRHDRAFKMGMSPLAREAARIMAAIRKQELASIWTPKYEDTLGHTIQGNLFPGIMFSLARGTIKTTKLWNIIVKMPKGALLHCHMDAMVDIDWLIEQALGQKGMHILSTEGLSDDKKLQEGIVTFRLLNESSVVNGPSIWSDRYIGGTPMSIEQAEKTFSGNGSFRDWLYSRCTITDQESINHHHGVDAIWKKFLSTFLIVRDLLFHESIFRSAMQRLLRQLAADRITYIDFRAAFTFEFYLEGKDTPQIGYEDFFRVWEEEIKRFKDTEEGKNFHGCRMIWTIIRRLDNRSIAESMEECIRIKKLFPQLICGFDCVGQEDDGRTLADLTPLLFWFKKKCYEADVDIPFFFHAGECLGDGNETDNNLFDAILLGTRRIGHGYSLYKHPLLIEMVKEKKILVESCPISNEVLRLSSSVLAHSLPALLSRGVAVSLNNDDPAILGHGENGLTHDFWQLFMASENLGLEGLATMAENSLRWCAVEDQKQSDWIQGIERSYLGRTVKAEMLKQWRSDFEKWCQWVIMEYPLEADLDSEAGSE
ncbi:MAG: hypothetical protein GOMPHAMPRED_004497 [Gomphillus americanus]|uniref:adenosine deaminase n=1 Tax=Gomphillus americanus TaxID=1940652 RepID=A0A8H3FPY3_9LECA|nr:MAG: hypothetical protein GOMPHAMPRED_004497 [Gomphillus americanus]